jgi:hypothetical protein
VRSLSSVSAVHDFARIRQRRIIALLRGFESCLPECGDQERDRSQVQDKPLHDFSSDFDRE